MPHSPFLLTAIAIFTSLGFATLLHALCEKVKHIPFPVALLVGGILTTLVSQQFDFHLFQHFAFSPEIVFYVFLPTLIFESAYHLNFRQFQNVISEVTILATFGLVLSTLIIATSLHLITDLPWMVSILFGTFISATDPVAVLAIFKKLRAPQRLSTIVDGESLLNDGTALVLFQFFKAIVVTGAIALTPHTFAQETGNFFLSLFEGIAVGVIFGWIFAQTITRAKDTGVQLTLSLILAHITFLVAEGLLHVSGILATMAAGIVMGNYGKRKLTPQKKLLFSEIWEFMGFISNALIFLLLGMKLGQIDFSQHWYSVAVASVVGIFVARPLSVFISFFITNRFRRKEDRISIPYQTITAWGGLKGALAAAAVLLIPESYPYAQQLQAMTAGVIVGTFLLNATTISWVLKKLRLIDFTISEKIQEFEVQILIDEAIKHHLKEMLDKKYIGDSIYKKLEKKYARAEEETIHQFESFQKTLQRETRETEKFLTYHALSLERQVYQTLHDQHELSDKRFMILTESMIRQKERLDRDELPEERKSHPKIAPQIPTCPFKPKQWFGLPKKCFDRFQKKQVTERLQHYRGRRISSWKLVRSLEILKQKHPLLKSSQVLEKIIARYKNWNKNTESKIKALEKDFPSLVSSARIHMAERVCLRTERQLLKKFAKNGLITEKVYKKMRDELDERILENFQWLKANYL